MNAASETRQTNLFQSAAEYATDATQRTILFWDTMRRRGNNYLEHRAKGQPPVLQFEYDTVIDGRTLDKPCNYALLFIKPDAKTPIDPRKRPYVVVDPRAGHGPGIGGFKADSQVGAARAAGHPVYFITFFPEPVPGQRLRDVAAAEALFLEEVAKRHTKASGKPCVVGNCQAGWAVAALAAVRPDVMGPILLNGAPLSYWSGADNKNPMRYTGGLLGGKWPESMMCDLGNGVFDGANLVSNFENLDPANTLWKKYYNLYSRIDTEPDRFLEFETWWGGYFLMNREEIDAIVGELFIGNKLTRQGIIRDDGTPLDLRNIKSPIVVFASHGDNITPPQQALNWIEDLYKEEKAIIADDQTIVYLLHNDIGHLGIFVSGKVATKEHAELIGTLEMIDALPAGLYEMVIEKKTDAARHADIEAGDYLVRFEARTMKDIHALDETREEEGRFQTVDAVSKINDRIYQRFVSPFIQSCSNNESAAMLRKLHPLRLQRELLSDENPAMRPVANLAEDVRRNRQPVSGDNPFLAAEQNWSKVLVASLDSYRDLRDAWCENIFNIMYGPAGFGALFPPTQAGPHAAPPPIPAQTLPAELFERGSMLAAVMRIVAAGIIDAGVFDRRSARIFQSIKEQSRFKTVPPERIHEMFKQQARLVRQDRERAMSSLAIILPTRDERRTAVDVALQIFMIAPEELNMDRPLVAKLSEVLQIDIKDLRTPPTTPAPTTVRAQPARARSS